MRLPSALALALLLAGAHAAPIPRRLHPVGLRPAVDGYMRRDATDARPVTLDAPPLTLAAVGRSSLAGLAPVFPASHRIASHNSQHKNITSTSIHTTSKHITDCIHTTRPIT
ncbi:hypothetical protein B0H17DRAFT_1204174 [Mycena rosella]|uniref:Uncharacterized protein n=1 Tax=Mycena rosella TaxID=1033263 RepID=A0AAD7DD36_MYCRO|nr:hypothetical protein B0H17DRAFT_1204174 [Mycena rosella]